MAKRGDNSMPFHHRGQEVELFSQRIRLRQQVDTAEECHLPYAPSAATFSAASAFALRGPTMSDTLTMPALAVVHEGSRQWAVRATWSDGEVDGASGFKSEQPLDSPSFPAVAGR